MRISFVILLLSVMFFFSCSDEVLKKNFHGKWKSVSDESELFVSDQMILSHTNEAGKRTMLGKSNISSGEVTIMNEDDFCSGVSGIYFYEIYKDTLQFRIKSDMCNVRKEILDRKKFLKN
jgi:hypothetical protein